MRTRFHLLLDWTIASLWTCARYVWSAWSGGALKAEAEDVGEEVRVAVVVADEARRSGREREDPERGPEDTGPVPTVGAQSTRAVKSRVAYPAIQRLLIDDGHICAMCSMKLQNLLDYVL